MTEDTLGADSGESDGAGSSGWARTGQDSAGAVASETQPRPNEGAEGGVTLDSAPARTDDGAYVDPERRQIGEDKFIALILILAVIILIVWLLSRQVVGA